MEPKTNITSHILFYNAVFNLIGKIIPLLIGVFSLPFIIKGLGVEQFGILTFVWISLVSYFYLLDFGSGQATIRFTAQLLEKKDKRSLVELFWTTFIFNLLIGVVGTVAIIAITPSLVNNILNIPEELKDIAQSSFFILAFAVPLVTVSSFLKSVLEGAQRYDLINLVKTPFNSFLFLIPLVSIFFSLKLPQIVFLLLLVQILSCLIYFLFCFKMIPEIRKSFKIKIKNVSLVLNFGKWIIISALALTFVANSERFFIGAIISLAEVSFYTASFDTITRILILPESLMVLFPAFSAFSLNNKKKAVFFYNRAFKHFIIIMGLISLVIIFFAPELLLFWLGKEFQEKSTTVLQILTVGIFLFSFSLLGENLIKGYGRPDLIGKLRLLEIPFYIPGLLFFINKFGIIGVALIWTIRAFIDAFLLILISFKILSQRFLLLLDEIKKALFFLLLFGVALLAGKILLEGFLLLFLVILVILTSIFIWYFYILDERELKFAKSILKIK